MPKVKTKDVKIEHERFREDMGEIEDLAVSIQRYGLFHPIVVDRAQVRRRAYPVA